MAYAQLFLNAGKFEFSVYQSNPHSNYMILDIRPFETTQKDIERVLFGRTLAELGPQRVSVEKSPLSVKFSTDAAIGYARWRIDYNWNAVHFATLLRGYFRNLAYRIATPGWLDEELKRAAMYEAWRVTPHAGYGGYAPRDFAARGGGAFEIKGFGFVWLGSERGEYAMHSRPYYRDKALNNDIRWYLERGTSLGEAIRLMRQQWHEISLVVISGFAGAVGGMSGIGGVGASNKIPDFLQQAITAGDTARSLSNEVFNTNLQRRPAELGGAGPALSLMKNSSNERRIQELRSVPVRRLRVLPRRQLDDQSTRQTFRPARAAAR